MFLVAGIISLINMQNFAERSATVLNVSVTDGVYTSFTRVKIEILPANRNNPVFPQLQIDVKVVENQPHGTLVTQVAATDKDFGIYGDIMYSIPSDLLREIFEIDKRTGNLATQLSVVLAYIFCV
jgi:protocadherin Fat 1/2/3